VPAGLFAVESTTQHPTSYRCTFDTRSCTSNSDDDEDEDNTRDNTERSSYEWRGKREGRKDVDVEKGAMDVQRCGSGARSFGAVNKVVSRNSRRIFQCSLKLGA
jgi:hypothetical protein